MNGLFRRTGAVLVAAAALSLASCITNTTDKDEGPGTVELEISLNFQQAADEDAVGFADYPAADVANYELSYQYTALPSPLSGNGLSVSGKNLSDDLFMFVKQQVVGLTPNARYQLKFEVTFATNAPSGCAGIGGAPGEGVTIKAGATATEPEAVNDGSGYLIMNIDKGNQVSSGTDAIAIGDFANSKDCSLNDFSYELKTVDSGTTLFTVYADADGAIWLLVGTDSGFEGTTSIYYVSAKVTATRIL